MKSGDMVKLAHYGTLVHKEEFEKYAVNKWGVGLITRVLPGGHLDQYGSKVDFMQVEVLWSKMNMMRTEDAEAVAVIDESR
jgi:hypothetical protein